MGDSSFVTWLSAVPLLVLLVLIVAAAVAWRSGGRSARIGAAILLVALGPALFLCGGGLILSLAGGALSFVGGLVLLIAEYRRGTVA